MLIFILINFPWMLCSRNCFVNHNQFYRKLIDCCFQLAFAAVFFSFIKCVAYSERAYNYNKVLWKCSKNRQWRVLASGLNNTPEHHQVEERRKKKPKINLNKKIFLMPSVNLFPLNWISVSHHSLKYSFSI